MCHASSGGKMKAGIYLGKEQIELRELPIPEVGDEDVLVENIIYIP